MKEFLKTLACKEENCGTSEKCGTCKVNCNEILSNEVNCMIYNNNRLNAVVVFSASGVHHHNF